MIFTSVYMHKQTHIHICMHSTYTYAHYKHTCKNNKILNPPHRWWSVGARSTLSVISETGSSFDYLQENDLGEGKIGRLLHMI